MGASCKSQPVQHKKGKATRPGQAARLSKPIGASPPAAESWPRRRGHARPKGRPGRVARTPGERHGRRPGPGPSFVEDDSLHLNEWRLTRPLLESILNGYTQQWPRQDGGAPRTGRALQGHAHHLACDQDTGRTSPGTPHRTARMAPRPEHKPPAHGAHSLRRQFCRRVPV